MRWVAAVLVLVLLCGCEPSRTYQVEEDTPEGVVASNCLGLANTVCQHFRGSKLVPPSEEFYRCRLYEFRKCEAEFSVDSQESPGGR